MGKLVVLRLDGDWVQQGFRVTLSIGSEDFRPEVEMTGYLPREPELATHLQNHWLGKYRRVGTPYRIKPQQIIYDGSVNERFKECLESATQLRSRLREWLDSESFRSLDKRLREELNRDEAIRVLIRTEDQLLQKLPWQEWDFFERYPKAEVALSATKLERIKTSTSLKLNSKVRILAILGHNEGIDIEADRHLLENLPDAETTFVVEKTRKEINDQLWEQPWDIIFFAGHSETEGETGRIYINKTESLTINEVWYALKKAVEGGLKLAIFNSCDGLGLARQLDDLQIPQMVVMRELVPDKVAQEFLKYFLTAFAGGKSFYLAVREARERLQGLEGKFPCASWLPVICQNLAEVPPNWDDLLQKTAPPKAVRQSRTLTGSWRQGWQGVLLASAAITSVVMGMRSLGILQASELKVFDSLMQRRPVELPDKRLLIVGADEEDISHRGYGYPLPDAILAQLINKLNQYQPSVIGLDIVRDQPVRPGHEALTAHLKQNKKLIAVCALGKNPQQSISPPPQIPTKRVGFADLYDDGDLNNQDYIVRRYLLSRTQNPIAIVSPCATPYSFGFQLAYRYLDAKGISVRPQEHNWQFGSVVAKPLESHSGGYQNLDARGNQLLINYRNTPDPQQIAQQVTVRDVLTNSKNFDPAWVRGRVVLIAVTAPSVQDTHHTPYGKMRGLYVHAHVISQILSAVEDNNRPLLWWWPVWGDALWIVFWSFTGGAIAWRLQAALYRGLVLSISALILYGLCWGFLTWGGWIPLVPSALALVCTAGSVVAYIAFQSREEREEKI
jgi:CHASE2 domain-containing sensor protein